MKKRYIRYRDTEIQRYGDTKTGQKKATQESDMPSRIIKENSDMFGEYLLSSFKDAIDKSYFPTALKQANITPVFKTGEKYSKDNYRPTGLLSNVSKKLKNLCFVKYLII